MKPEDLRNIYHSTDSLHNSLLDTLDNLDDQAPMRYNKSRKTLKIALTCAMIAVLSTATAVAAATNLFGLLNKPIGKYGYNVEVEGETIPSNEKKHVKLKLDYTPEGYRKFDDNPSYAIVFEPFDESKADKSFIITVEDADGYQATNRSVVDTFEAEYNGRHTIISTHKYAGNREEYYYTATQYFKDWGYVVEATCPDKDELIKVMQNIELEENTEYVEPATMPAEEITDLETAYRYAKSCAFTENNTFHQRGKTIECRLADGNPSNDFAIDITSVEERFNSQDLDRENFFGYNTKYDKHNIFFDDNGKLISQYTRTDTIHGDGINSLNEKKEVVDDRHFYVATIDITATNKDIEDFNLGYEGDIYIEIAKYENNQFIGINSGGRVETIYFSPDGELGTIKKGETKTLTYGFIVDDDALDVAYINCMYNELDSVDSDGNTAYFTTYQHAIKLKGGVQND